MTYREPFTIAIIAISGILIGGCASNVKNAKNEKDGDKEQVVKSSPQERPQAKPKRDGKAKRTDPADIAFDAAAKALFESAQKNDPLDFDDISLAITRQHPQNPKHIVDVLAKARKYSKETTAAFDAYRAAYEDSPERVQARASAAKRIPRAQRDFVEEVQSFKAIDQIDKDRTVAVEAAAKIGHDEVVATMEKLGAKAFHRDVWGRFVAFRTLVRSVSLPDPRRDARQDMLEVAASQESAEMRGVIVAAVAKGPAAVDAIFEDRTYKFQDGTRQVWINYRNAHK